MNPLESNPYLTIYYYITKNENLTWKDYEALLKTFSPRKRKLEAYEAFKYFKQNKETLTITDVTEYPIINSELRSNFGTPPLSCTDAGGTYYQTRNASSTYQGQPNDDQTAAITVNAELTGSKAAFCDLPENEGTEECKCSDQLNNAINERKANQEFFLELAETRLYTDCINKKTWKTEHDAWLIEADDKRTDSGRIEKINSDESDHCWDPITCLSGTYTTTDYTFSISVSSPCGYKFPLGVWCSKYATPTAALIEKRMASILAREPIRDPLEIPTPYALGNLTVSCCSNIIKNSTNVNFEKVSQECKMDVKDLIDGKIESDAAAATASRAKASQDAERDKQAEYARQEEKERIFALAANADEDSKREAIDAVGKEAKGKEAAMSLKNKIIIILVIILILLPMFGGLIYFLNLPKFKFGKMTTRRRGRN